MYKSVNSLNDHDIPHDIDDLTRRSSDWLFTFHPDKCTVLEVSKSSFLDYDYLILICALQFMSQVKDFGL